MTGDGAPERLLSTVDAARRLRMQPATLKAWRFRRQGPSYILVSARCVRYRQRDLDAWVAGRRVEHDGTRLIPAARAP
jgi:hypothetical protein